jgi:hypothetical protein
MQEADSLGNESRRKIGTAKIPDLDRPRESILQGNGDSLPGEWPFQDHSNGDDTENDQDGGARDQGPARNG